VNVLGRFAAVIAGVLLAIPAAAHAQSSEQTLGTTLDALNELGAEKVHVLRGQLSYVNLKRSRFSDANTSLLRDRKGEC